MKIYKSFLLLLIAVSGTLQVIAQQLKSHDIKIKLTPFTNCNIYLLGSYGTTQFIADTAFLNDKSEGAFKNKTKLTSGLYSLVTANNKTLFQLLLDSVQKFSIVADTADLENYTISGSAENDIFMAYVRKNNRNILDIGKLNQQLNYATDREDSIKIRMHINNVQNRIAASRDSMIQQYPETLVSLLLQVAKPAVLPPGTVIKTRQDSINATRYFLKHYWDGIPFNDDRLLYIPYFESKLDDYLKYFVPRDPDSVINQLQYMLLYARTGKQMYPYLLLKFTNMYLNPTHVGQNKVLLYLFQNYYLRGDTTILNEPSRKALYERVYALMANQVGDPAPPLDLTLINGTPISLYSVAAPYTFVVFWDPSCSHCQQYVPQIDSIYKAKWNRLGLKVFSVNINTALNREMAAFIQNKKLSLEWIFAYQADTAAKAIAESGKLNYHQLYDVYETPTMYLLDEHKRIIAKGLSLQQFDAVLEARNKK